MRAAINCALANRELIGHLVREVFARRLPQAELRLLYDVSHNTCKEEEHVVDGRRRRLFVHRKGATRAFGPGHPDLPPALRSLGQPVLIGGTMGTGSYVLAGTRESEQRAFSSACHGAGRRLSRTKARKTWHGATLIRELAQRGILVRAHGMRGAAEEAPGAYKDVDRVAEVAEVTGLARRVARVRPVACVKG
jgi:tRNA-splicing ligase RtcB